MAVSRKDLFLILALVAGAIVYLGIEARDKDDFWIFYSGARDLFAGENIYTKIYNEWYHYLYSVFFAVLLYPLTLLPFAVSKFLWLGINIFFLYRIFVLIFSYLDLDEFSKKQRSWFLIASILFCVRFMHDNFHYGQITVFLLFLCLQGIDLIFRNKPLWGALLIALGINIKILPVVLLPYLLYRGKFLAAGYVFLFCAILLFLPSAFIGHEHNMFLLETWWAMMNPNNLQHVIDTYDGGLSGLSTLFSVYLYDLTPDPAGYGTKINIASLSVEQLKWVTDITRAALILCTLFFLRTLPFRDPLNKKHMLLELSWVLALIPLIFPHQQFYAFLFQLPAVIFILHYLFTGGKKNMLIVLLALIFLCFNLQLLLGEFKDVYQHFKIVTFGGLGVLGALWLSKRHIRS